MCRINSISNIAGGSALLSYQPHSCMTNTGTFSSRTSLVTCARATHMLCFMLFSSSTKLDTKFKSKSPPLQLVYGSDGRQA